MAGAADLPSAGIGEAGPTSPFVCGRRETAGSSWRAERALGTEAPLLATEKVRDDQGRLVVRIGSVGSGGDTECDDLVRESLSHEA